MLVAESFAPWSEKARWALDHHHWRYDYREYVPLIDEPWLRWQLGDLTGRVSTPTLLTDTGHERDSLAIALYAERRGAGTPLFPAAHADAIAEWDARSEAALSAGRVRVVTRLGEVPGARDEMLPAAIPAFLKPALGVATDATVAFLRWKYGVGSDLAASDRTLREVLGELQGALAGRDHLLEGFTYADITMAVVLQMIAPVSDAYIHLGPAVRAVWTNEALAAEFADLVAWRDRLYAAHRRPPVATP